MGDYPAEEIHNWTFYAVFCSCKLLYVGRTGYRYPMQRWHNHRSHLRYNKHCNPLLQAHHNKFDDNHFRYQELSYHENLTTNGAKRIEYDLICKFKSYSSEHGFNINHIVIDKLTLLWPTSGNMRAPSPTWNRPATEETRLIASERLKKRWKDPAFVEKIRAGAARFWADPDRVALAHANRVKAYKKKPRHNCIIDGCSRKYYAKGRCAMHYYRIRRKEHKRNKQ